MNRRGFLKGIVALPALGLIGLPEPTTRGLWTGRVTPAGHKSLADIVAASLKGRSRHVVDNFVATNPLLQRLAKST